MTQTDIAPVARQPRGHDQTASSALESAGPAVENLPHGSIGLHAVQLRIVVISLVGSAFFSAYSLAAYVLLGLATAVGLLALLAHPRLKSISVAAICVLTYWLASGLIAHSLPPSGSVVDWLNGDGRVAVGLLPFILLGNAVPSEADLHFFVRFVRAMVWLGAGLFVIALVHTPLSHQIIQGGLFFGLTSSHHTVGYIYATSLLVLLARGHAIGPRARTLSVLAAAVLVAASGSRTALLGLGAATVWFIAKYASGAVRVRALVGIGAAALALVVAVPRVSGTVALASSTGSQSATQLFDAGYMQTSLATVPGAPSSDSQAVANAENRFALYGFALGRWLQSPIFGIGSGRFDDYYSRYTGVPGLLRTATEGVDQPGYATAHNSYLETLAENGVAGLLLMLLLYWRLPYRLLASQPRDIRLLGGLLILFMLGTAVTGSTLDTIGMTGTAATWLMLLLPAA